MIGSSKGEATPDKSMRNTGLCRHPNVVGTHSLSELSSLFSLFLYLSSVRFYHPSMFIPFFFWEIDECSTYCKWPYKTIVNNAMNLFFPQQRERNRFTNGTFWGNLFQKWIKVHWRVPNSPKLISLSISWKDLFVIIS